MGDIFHWIIAGTQCWSFLDIFSTIHQLNVNSVYGLLHLLLFLSTQLWRGTKTFQNKSAHQQTDKYRPLLVERFYVMVGRHRASLKYSVIQKDGLNFVRLNFLNYIWYVNDLHNIWERRSYIFKYHRQSARLAHSRAAASVESKMAAMQHKIFCLMDSLKLSRRLLYSVRFVFVSTFNLQQGRAFVVGITNLSK